MKYPDQTKTLALLEQWHTHYIQLTNVCNSLKPAFGESVFDTPMWNTIWQTFDLYTDTLAESLGATEQYFESWLHYFWNECSMGENAGRCTVNGMQFTLTNVHDLCALIMKVRE